MADIINVLVVDDSAYSRKALSEILESTRVCRVLGTARDGEDAIRKAIELKPDLITLDLEMPKMDGFTFLRILMKSMPTPVLVISSMAHRKMVFRALEMGAMDFLAKPDPSIGADLYDMKEDIINKVKVVGQLQMLNIQRRLSRPPIEEEVEAPRDRVRPVKEKKRIGRFDCVVIGSSTGGPTALQEILSSLPGDLPVGVAVSQHMPAGYTRAFAERLNKYSEWFIKEAEEGEPMARGKALVAPGGYHMTIVKDNKESKIHIVKRHSGDKHVPSIDKLFSTAAQVYGQRLLAVVLTGMGNDGADGALEIKKQGGMVFAESPETAIVYGMPREVSESGAADRSVALDKMAKEIARAVVPRNEDGVECTDRIEQARKK